MGIFSKSAQTVEDDVRNKPFDVTTIESEIATELHRSRGTVALLNPVGSLEDFAPQKPDLGQLSADAVEAMYKEAATAIEAMGADLLDVARSAEKMASDVKAAIEFVHQTAEQYRTEAARVKARIEAANELTVKVREACEDMRTKINLPAVEGQYAPRTA